ncbi:hypothetical protein BU24DRAFT_424763 [Aaosphaeria arxii CBS 175.79]|uniref:GPI-anchored cell wall organization protein Ecm33 n=1 Tax=Aaosphaeria arxii CBS 175.79 TaxID=1450172 RepID=A0A6A5XLI9_9PLEO|nr:uncharacterized protein BU24DRAFT_424763 [Aaosphaeria arxii CBS 175.79]KAF2013756.1 hypothetical protein BU24DRAFT_424763 [Aaosphaeria arxii CBS 175.79]
MSLSKYAVPVLAVAGSAYAACSASPSPTVTVQNAGDVAAFTTCRTFSGSIAVATGATDFQLSGVRELNGNLVVLNNTQISGISADSLETIKGTFRLDNLESLTSLNFPKLTQVEEIEWTSLSRLDTIGFDSEVTEADSVKIENTFLSSLKGINLATVKTLKLANNKQINDITMENLGNVSEILDFSDNNVDVNVSLPNLLWASNMTFRNVSSLDLPSLETLNGSFNLVNNAFLSFKAPNLTTIGGALSFVSNTELTNLTLPELTEVKENLEIANNTKLHKIDGIPKLKTIRGALDFNGNMSEVALPAINHIFGAFNLQSTGDIDCDKDFKPLKSSGKIEGRYFCKGNVAKPGGEGTTPTVTGSGASKTNAASPANVGSNVLMAGLAAAFFL